MIVQRSGTRPIVVDRLPAASEVERAMTLEQALSLHPDAVVLEIEERYYAHEHAGNGRPRRRNPSPPPPYPSRISPVSSSGVLSIGKWPVSSSCQRPPSASAQRR